MHWWRRAYPGHTRAGYPPVGLVVTDAGSITLANRQEAVAGLSADCWVGSWWAITRHDNDGDGWREYHDAVPVVATTLELLAEHGRSGPSGGAMAARVGIWPGGTDRPSRAGRRSRSSNRRRTRCRTRPSSD
ncbi:hypothetical protein ACWC9T_35660 [Kitasatospora sp. NPDC001159]